MVTMGDNRHEREEERVTRTGRAHIIESGQLPACAPLRTPGMATHVHLEICWPVTDEVLSAGLTQQGHSTWKANVLEPCGMNSSSACCIAKSPFL